MWFRKCFGYISYPVLVLALVFPLTSRAQQSLPPDASQQDQATQAQAQTTQQRALVLQEAQRRLRTRRKQRIRQIVHDTYSHQYEAYFGAGYTRFNPGPSLQHNSEANWEAGLTDYLKGNLGVTADFRGYYGTAFTGIHPINQAYKPGISQYTALVGPQYRFYRGQHWGWSAEVLGGVGRGNFSTGTNGLPPTVVGLYNDATTFNLLAGASVDYNLSPGLAIRLTPNYLLSKYGGNIQNNKGWTMALVYRFGHQR
jgi:hypothetical protein